VIVISVLVALGADAWWESRGELAKTDAYLAALGRDFDQMSARVEASIATSRNGYESGRSLLAALATQGSAVDPQQASRWMFGLFGYEVFSPSAGAYQALTTSGDIDLLPDEALKQDLADFFGATQDYSSTEAVLAETRLALSTSEAFRNTAGLHRLSGDLRALGFDGPAVNEWAASEALLNDIASVTLSQAFALGDYEDLRDQIAVIRERLGVTKR